MNYSQLNPKNFPVTDEIQSNLRQLLELLNMLETQHGSPFIVTSGLRTMEDHLRIYKQKAAAAGVPFDISKVPMNSKHLSGQAADLSDPGLKITAWLKANPEILEGLGLYCEEGNANWVHAQPVAPKSGERWFKP